MADSAALNHAASILARLARGDRADSALRDYFDAHRHLPPALRGAVSRALFAYFRWLSWLDAKASPQKRLAQAAELQQRFQADPKSLKPEALAARAVPAWIWNELSLPDSGSQAAFLQQLQREPALWLRARPGQARTLATSLFAAEVADLSNFKSQISYGGIAALDAVRFTGVQDLFKTEQFKTGEFEIQDLASQLVGLACAPQPGQTWWDACAGEGGKTLHLCDLMKNKGLVWASDRHTGRLENLKRRTARAKLFNYRTAVWDGSARLPTKTKFDGILVDAPCSGVGTWQRNPQARWTTSPEDVTELAATQLALLNHVAGSLKPGGRLVYSVCTLTRRETTAVADTFTAAHPELEPAPVFGAVAGVVDSGPDSTSAATIWLWPHELNANGMFIAAWRRKKP
jgi:16S rRNA (cytosine967-C5)-methyltransferase